MLAHSKLSGSARLPSHRAQQLSCGHLAAVQRPALRRMDNRRRVGFWPADFLWKQREQLVQQKPASAPAAVVTITAAVCRVADDAALPKSCSAAVFLAVCSHEHSSKGVRAACQLTKDCRGVPDGKTPGGLDRAVPLPVHACMR